MWPNKMQKYKTMQIHVIVCPSSLTCKAFENVKLYKGFIVKQGFGK